MNNEFISKLKETLEDFDKRIRMLEHLTNDVIIGSLENAANEYADNEAFDNFKSNYSDSLKDLVEPYKKLFGEDYDLERSLYDDLKATEGYGSEEFDEAACMEARIADLKSRIDAIREDVAEVVEDIEEKKDNEDEVIVEEKEISDEQLAKELKDAISEGVV